MECDDSFERAMPLIYKAARSSGILDPGELPLVPCSARNLGPDRYISWTGTLSRVNDLREILARMGCGWVNLGMRFRDPDGPRICFEHPGDGIPFPAGVLPWINVNAE